MKSKRSKKTTDKMRLDFLQKYYGLYALRCDATLGIFYVSVHRPAPEFPGSTRIRDAVDVAMKYHNGGFEL